MNATGESREMSIELLYLALFKCLLNIPFGYWRAKTEKRSLMWFLSIHLPIPCIAVVRSLAGIPLNLTTFPVLICAFLVGQYTGSAISHWRANHPETRVTSCLVWDLVYAIRNR